MTKAFADGTGMDSPARARELRRWLALYAKLQVGDASWAYRSFAQLVSDHGFYQQPSPWVHDGLQRPGQCFSTASQWAERAGWTYVEGYVLVPSAAPFSCFEHAWCLTDQGVADPCLPDGTAVGYVGIPLTDSFRRQQQALRATHAVFVADPVNPLAGINEDVLRAGLPSQAVAGHGPGPRSAASL
ncbi:hypothetical protein [Streptomyces sp. NPDC005302]|uniref:hypothetical protein n=1 Tax=Streptomyces sp. NPDC005302 TaxID=3154675 RepID=UPI0033AB0A14